MNEKIYIYENSPDIIKKRKETCRDDAENCCYTFANVLSDKHSSAQVSPRRHALYSLHLADGGQKVFFYRCFIQPNILFMEMPDWQQIIKQHSLVIFKAMLI